MRKSITIDKLDCPIHDPNQTAQATEGHRSDGIALRSLVVLRDAAGLAEHVDESDDKRAETDAAKGVSHGALEGASGGATRHTARLAGAEEPAAVDAGDGGVDGVFDPFGDPVAGERDEDDQADDCGRGAAAAGCACRVGAAVVGRIFDVDGDEGDAVPGTEGEGDEAAQSADGEDVAVVFGDVHGCLEHEDAEGDAGDPGRALGQKEERWEFEESKEGKGITS